MATVSIYFYAGDFADVLRRFEEGRQQIYQTHNEVARLTYELLAAGFHVNFYSFVSPERRMEQPLDRFRFISLGAKDYSAATLLKSAVAEDDADMVVTHFASIELLRAITTKKSRAMALFANSYNRKGIRSAIEKYKVVSVLNNSRFELVSNHCLPSTRQLAQIGVRSEKLIAYDTPHPFDPAAFQAKNLIARQRFEVVYAGSVVEDKGVPELIQAIALLRARGIEVHCSLAGLGDIDAMKALAAKRGVSDLLSFVGIVGNNEVFNMMAAADLVVVPSRTVYPEGFPYTMFEAIASRTPIVCSDHPMFRSIIQDGQNASLFPAGDYEAFAAAMQRTLTQPDLYARLSNNAPSTWNALKGPADWRTLIVKWIVDGKDSPWIRDHMLLATEQRRLNARPQTATGQA